MSSLHRSSWCRPKTKQSCCAPGGFRGAYKGTWCRFSRGLIFCMIPAWRLHLYAYFGCRPHPTKVSQGLGFAFSVCGFGVVILKSITAVGRDASLARQMFGIRCKLRGDSTQNCELCVGYCLHLITLMYSNSGRPLFCMLSWDQCHTSNTPIPRPQNQS